MSSKIASGLIKNGFKNITLESRELLGSYFKKENCSFSDYSFSMLYAWAASETIFYKVTKDGGLAVARILRGKIDLLYPPLALERERCAPAINEISSDFFDAYASASCAKPFSYRILSVPEEKLEIFSAISAINGGVYEDLPDYIYDYQQLIDLSGKKYRNKRENINKFIRNYANNEICDITAKDIAGLRKFLARWYYENKPGRKIHLSELFDMHAINYEKNYVLESYQTAKMLKNYEKLKLSGMYIKLYGSIVGFIIGEQTSTDTFTVLVEKVDNQFFGLSQFLFREFLLARVSANYVNTSDDSGMPGLRVLKESYQPLFLKKRFFMKVICN